MGRRLFRKRGRQTITSFLRKRPKKGASLEEIEVLYGYVSMWDLRRNPFIKEKDGRYFFVREKERILQEVMDS